MASGSAAEYRGAEDGDDVREMTMMTAKIRLTAVVDDGGDDELWFMQIRSRSGT